MASLALPKNNPYTQTISQGYISQCSPTSFLFSKMFVLLVKQTNRILELQQIGLVGFWDTWFRPMPPQCNGKSQSGNKKKEQLPLSLKNLSATFLVLLAGLGLSLLVFLGERILSIAERRRSHRANKLQPEPNNLIEKEEPTFILE